MAAGDAYLERLDAVISQVFADWNVYTTIFATTLFIFLAYPWLIWRDPDTHPFLLARQASASPIRQSGQTALYRSIDVPYGYPLRAGLNIKDPGAPKWSSGRNGDLRDIWRQAARGPVKEDGSPAGPKGKILTVLGNEQVIEHDLADITRDINAIGKYIQESNGKCVAICLANSVELLASIFAAAFYGFHPVLIPHNISTDRLITYLSEVSPDFLIAEAGAVELLPVITATPSVKQVIWVAKGDSKFMNWDQTPEGVKGKAGVAVWHELIEARKASTSSEVLPVDKESKVGPISTFWRTEDGTAQRIDYTSENMVAAVAGLISALPRNQRIGPEDVVLPITPLLFSYPLALTFAALFSNATVALNSATAGKVDFALATANISPTIIIASSRTIYAYHDKFMSSQTGIVAKTSRFFQGQKLQAGNMPSPNPMFKLANLDTKSDLSKLRLLLIFHRAGDPTSTKLSSALLSDLRMVLGTRVCYALTAAKVAGALCQTNAFDYRQYSGAAHFGPPPTCVEIHLMGSEKVVQRPEPQGQVVVRGPAVCGGETTLDVSAELREDNTLSLL